MKNSLLLLFIILFFSCKKQINKEKTNLTTKQESIKIQEPYFFSQIEDNKNYLVFDYSKNCGVCIKKQIYLIKKMNKNIVFLGIFPSLTDFRAYKSAWKLNNELKYIKPKKNIYQEVMYFRKNNGKFLQIYFPKLNETEGSITYLNQLPSL